MGKQVAAGLKRGLSSVGRAPALQAGGREFESLSLHFRSRRLLKQIRLHLENFTQIRDIRREACHPFRKKGWRAPEEYHPNKPIETRGLFR